MRYLGLLVIVWFWGLGCGKLGKDRDYHYTLANLTNKTVKFKVYSTQDDYNNATNPLTQYTIKAGENVVIQLTPLRDYYFDWYSEDYNIGNWPESAQGSGLTFSPVIKYNAPKIDDNINITSPNSYYDTSRSILLNGDEWGSRWRSAEEYNNNVLVGVAPYIEILLKKEFTAQITQTDGAGDTFKTWYQYTRTAFGNTSIKTMSVSIRPNPSFSIAATLNYSSSISAVPHTTRDTLTSSFLVNNGYKTYTFVRE